MYYYGKISHTAGMTQYWKKKIIKYTGNLKNVYLCISRKYFRTGKVKTIHAFLPGFKT